MRLVSISITIILSCTAFGAEKNGVSLPDSITVDGHTLTLNGLGVRKAFGVVKVYVGGLYVEKKSTKPEEILAETSPKRVVLQMLMDVNKEKLQSAWAEGFKKNCKEKCDQNNEGLQKLIDSMENVRPKDQLVFTIYPGSAPDHTDSKVEVDVKGARKASIPGSLFARTMLSVFIMDPPNAALKEGMLGLN